MGTDPDYKALYEAERERADALAAHVAAANGIIDEWGDMYLSNSEAGERLSAWREDKPQSSLAQRDARVAAEALHKAAETLEFKPATSGWLHFMANRVVERGVDSVFADEIDAGGGHD